MTKDATCVDGTERIRTKGKWTRQGTRWRYVLTLSGKVETGTERSEGSQ